MIGIININFMAEWFYWIVLDCTRVPNKAHNNTVYKNVIYHSWKMLEKLNNAP